MNAHELPDDLDYRDWSDVETLVSALQETAVQCFDEDQGIETIGFAAVMKNPADGTAYERPTLCTVVNPPGIPIAAPDGMVRTVVLDMSRTAGSVLGAMVTEVWYVDPSDDEVLHRFREHKEAGGEMKDFPGVEERVMITLEHVTHGKHLWSAQITRDDSGRGTLGEFVHRTPQTSHKAQLQDFIDLVHVDAFPFNAPGGDA